jgi:FkbM family methyltransferase
MYVDYFQVGAHIGPSNEDDLFDINLENKTLILIEPVPYLFTKLQDNYSEKAKNNNIIFKNIAVSNKDGFLQLYVPSPINDWSKNPAWASQLGSVNETHIKRHLPYLLVDTINVPCYRLNTIIKDMNISSIDNLLVDTEGHDYDILMDLDLSVLKPNNITFENKHMDGVFIKGERYNKLIEHFIRNGYVKVEDKGDNTIIKLIE